jgi:hypothetical protein
MYKYFFVIVIILFFLNLIKVNNCKKIDNYKEHYNKKFKSINTPLTKIVTLDSSGNLDTTNIDTLTTNGININKWGIYQVNNNNLCFQRNDLLATTEPICFNGDTISNGGGRISSPRNSVKAWVNFNSTSFVDVNKQLYNYPSLSESQVTKTLTKKSSGSSDPGWNDGFNILKIVRLTSDKDVNRPDTYRIFFNTPMKDDKYAVLLGQGDPNGLSSNSWQNLLGITNKTTEFVEIFIRGDHPNGTVVAPWYDTNRNFIMNVMIYQ